MVFLLPFSATEFFNIGGDPVLLPVGACLAFAARHAFSMMIPAQRELFFTILSREGMLIGFLGYCVASAILWPRLFSGRTYVPSQDPLAGGILELGPAATSIAQIGYLVIGVYTFIALRQAIARTGLEAIVIAVVAQAVAIGGLGLVQALGGIVGAPIDTGWIVNATGYRLLNAVEAAGFVRVSSVFTEASAYAGWVIGPVGFFYALFVNRIMPLTSLIIGGALVATMILSTSSTAYAALALFAAVAAALAIIDPNGPRRERSLVVVLAGAGLIAVAAGVLFTAESGPVFELRMMLEAATIAKQYSDSALERGLLSQTAMQAGVDTLFLGAGYGAVRASGLFQTLFGSIGLPGLVLFGLVLLPMLAAPFRKLVTGEDAVASAAAYALIGTLGAMLVSGAGLGLTTMFWAFGAMAKAPALAALRRPQPDRTTSAETPTAQPMTQ